MVEFGDELIIESYRIPWLIWIQLVVTVLLIVLLFFCFSNFSSEPSTSSSAAASPARDASRVPPSQLDKPSSSRRKTRLEDQTVKRDAGTSGGSIREVDENGEESSLKDSAFLRIFRHPHHPCNYFGLVKQAFFKCFGMDSRSPNSDNHHEKQD